jgi:tagatose 6-phosphate kinase
VVLSGSLPPGFPPDAYGLLTDLAHDAGATVLLDAGGEALTLALGAGPDVVKPNLAELEAQARRSLDGVDDVLDAGEAVLAKGAAAVVVTMGAEGLVALTGDGVFRARGPRVVGGNPTGAGDALSAALASGLSRRLPWPRVIRQGMAVAAATAGLPQAGETDLAMAERWRDQVQVEELSWAW